MVYFCSILDGGIENMIKSGLKYFWIILMACSFTACMNGGGDLAGKWQLRQYQYADGTLEKVDSVFYNFQKGSFSAICLLKDGGVDTFFGDYSLKGAEISIILLPESINDRNYNIYFGWPEGKRTFKVEDLSYSSLRLEFEGTKSAFRKY